MAAGRLSLLFTALLYSEFIYRIQTKIIMRANGQGFNLSFDLPNWQTGVLNTHIEFCHVLETETLLSSPPWWPFLQRQGRWHLFKPGHTATAKPPYRGRWERAERPMRRQLATADP